MRMAVTDSRKDWTNSRTVIASVRSNEAAATRATIHSSEDDERTDRMVVADEVGWTTGIGW
jgi:hypothetical protein